MISTQRATVDDDFEVVATPAHDPRHLRVWEGLESRQVRLEQFFRRLQRGRVRGSTGRVGGVLAAPLARDLVEGDVATCASVVNGLRHRPARAAQPQVTRAHRGQGRAWTRPPLPNSNIRINETLQIVPGMVGMVREVMRWTAGARRAREASIGKKTCAALELAVCKTLGIIAGT